MKRRPIVFMFSSMQVVDIEEHGEENQKVLTTAIKRQKL